MTNHGPKHIRHGFTGINIGQAAEHSPSVDHTQMTSDMISQEENQKRLDQKAADDKAADKANAPEEVSSDKK